MPTPADKEMIEALEAVMDPIFQRPMLSLGMLEDVIRTGSGASMTVRLSAPSRTVQAQIREALEQALMPLGVTALQIKWDLQVPTRTLSGEDPAPSVRNVVAVLSGKGGVGKSTCAANVAMALARAGAKVGLLDADIYGPSVPTLFGVMEHPTSSDGKKITPIERFNVKLMSIGFLTEDPKEAVVWRGPMLHTALMQFLRDVNWGELDYLVLDLPPGTGDVALSLSKHVSMTGAVVITTPQEVALQDVYKAVSMCTKLSLPILGIVENMSHFVDSGGVHHHIFGAGGGQKVAEFARAPLLAQLPIDPKVAEWGDKGVPLVQAQPDSPSAAAFSKLAEDLAIRIAELHFERGGSQKAPKSEATKHLKVLR
ncbi:MAG: Mrp/NBP35 family ATP-binding protein [Myxococcales bacterium]|nr:Mrp/NBP35 family ATP-binding protein [Myxococcales bacterium]MCB9707576.1 Mrp/NBP35 family ATP-binding protein [Myxococcales bacterium]